MVPENLLAIFDENELEVCSRKSMASIYTCVKHDIHTFDPAALIYDGQYILSSVRSLVILKETTFQHDTQGYLSRSVFIVHCCCIEDRIILFYLASLVNLVFAAADVWHRRYQCLGF